MKFNEVVNTDDPSVWAKGVINAIAYHPEVIDDEGWWTMIFRLAMAKNLRDSLLTTAELKQYGYLDARS